MAISFTCGCGQRLEAPEDKAGSKMRCPRCREGVRVPEEAGDSYGVEETRKCPGCRREWPLDAVICIDCGFNFDTGRKMKTKYHIPERIFIIGSSWAGTYSRYRIYRNHRGKPCLDIHNKFLFIPTGGATHDLTLYSAILTDYTPGGDEEPGDYTLQLQAPGRRPVTIFRSSNDEAMRELIDVIAAAGRLEIKRA